MPPRRPHSRSRAAALLLVLAALACTAPASRAPAARLPSVIASQRATPSTSAVVPGAAPTPPSAVTLSGGTLATLTGEPDAAVEPPTRRFARVELVRFPTRLSRELPRITDEFVAVVADDGQRALRPASLWFGEARHAVPEALWNASRATGLWQALVAWEGDEQLVLQLALPDAADEVSTTRLRIELRPAAAPEHWSVGLLASGPRPNSDAALADADSDDLNLRPASFTEPRGERVLLRPFHATREHALTLLLPSPWGGDWLGLRLTPLEPDENQARAALAKREQRLAVAPSEPPANTLTATSLSSVLRAGLARSETRRATLQHGAGAARLPLLAELALIAPRALVDRIALRTSQRLDAGQPVSLRTLLGGLLDALSDQQLDPEASARVEAVLREHLGALDRRRSLLADALPGFGDDVALEAFLRRENALLLEDSRADTRLRAYEWLARRKLEPPGYDPLGTRAERRAALEAAVAAAAEEQS